MTTATASKWIHVTKHNPCPICGKPDWCLISKDVEAAICARISKFEREGSLVKILEGTNYLHCM